MSHVAFMPDTDLCALAGAGEAAACLVLIDRHAAALCAAAAQLSGRADLAALATVDLFARLLTGHLAGAADVAALHAALPCILADISAAALSPASNNRTAVNTNATAALTTATLVEALLVQLPAGAHAALAAAWREAQQPVVAAPVPAATAPVRQHGIADTAAVATPFVPDPALLAAVRERPSRLPRHLAAAPSPVGRWAVVVVALLVCGVLWYNWPQWSAPPTIAEPPPQRWPTLVPREKVVVAQREPYPDFPSAAATVAAAANPAVPAAPVMTATAPAVVVAPAPSAAAPVASAPPVAAYPPLPPAVESVKPAAPLPAVVQAPETPGATPTASNAKLTLTTEALAFGIEIGPRAVIFRNTGSDPLTWRLVADSTWVELTQPGGTLAAGASQAVPLTIARADLPTGAYAGTIQVLTNGGEALVPVSMTISPSHTTISRFTGPTAPLNAAGCAAPTTYLVSATIAGQGPPQKAVVYYALNEGVQQTHDLQVQGQQYTATIGPFSQPGAVTYALVLTEASGEVVRSASYTLPVNDCPSRTVATPTVRPASGTPPTPAASPVAPTPTTPAPRPAAPATPGRP